MFKDVKDTTMAETKNFYPCVLIGKAERDVVSPPNFYWNQIAWRICSDKKNKVELLLLFYRHENVDGRAICTLDTVTGRVSEFRYQDAKTFDYFEDAVNVNSMKIFKAKGNDAFKYAISLTHYFGRVNAAEYEKKTVLKEAAFEKNLAAKPIHTAAAAERESSYNPDREKIVYINQEKKERAPRNYVKKIWQKAGHFRHCKNGKVVFIKPTVCRRKQP